MGWFFSLKIVKSTYRISAAVGFLTAAFWLVWWIASGSIPREVVFGCNMSMLWTIPGIMLLAGSLAFHLYDLEQEDFVYGILKGLFSVLALLVFIGGLLALQPIFGIIIATLVSFIPTVFVFVVLILASIFCKDGLIRNWLAGE